MQWDFNIKKKTPVLEVPLTALLDTDAVVTGGLEWSSSPWTFFITEL